MRAAPTTRCIAATATVITHARLGLVLDGFGNQPATAVSNMRAAAPSTSAGNSPGASNASSRTGTTSFA